MKITLIAGARPNFMKIAPIIHAIKNAQTEGKNINYRLVHTGQHYDQKMSDTFFKELNIPEPDVNHANIIEDNRSMVKESDNTVYKL